ncbi:MAG: GNAT family N-acetyltransferase [Pseudomonadota bacterium]
MRFRWRRRTEPIDIRPARPDDLARLHEIRAAAFAPVFASFRRIVGNAVAETAFAGAEEEQASHLDDLAGGAHGAEILVAVRGGRAIGFCAVLLGGRRGLGEIGLNAVDPAHQRRGVATALFDAALARMRAVGCTCATVSTGGDASHAPARAAYVKLGFRTAIPALHLYRRL